MHITPAQAAQLHQKLATHLRYLGRLQARMEKVGFVPKDPLFQRVTKAHDSIHDLVVHLHYLSCGTNRSPPNGKRSDL